MVRALLCESCNTLEGRQTGRQWNVYRKFAPANGWFCRYFGWGEQWRPSDPDPFPNRLKMPFPPAIDLASRPAELVREYERAIESMEPTPIPLTCQRRFEYDIPLLLPGERYLLPHEPRGMDRWPIAAI
jgi:hypothetical protein